jgi:N-acetyl-gamma-glutamylphosphate reductase
MRAAVIGSAGYVGGELLRIVLQHPEVTECIATSRSQAG